MNNVVTDLDQRRQVISAEGSFIVRAPAGSGKTELLIQRYLHLLALVDAPEEIVAITFTRKAAAEMQTRILKALESARNETEPEADHARQTWQLAQAALARASQLDWQLEQIPARLKIQTIDSLCATLTRQMPLLSGLGAQPETVEDATPLYEQAAINTLSELESDAHWSDSIARLLIHLDNDLPRIKQLIMNMLGKRDQWLRHVVPDLQREELESALQHVIREKLAQLRDLMPAELENALCETAAFAALNLKESSPDHPLTHCSFMTEYPGAAVDDLPSWLGLCELLLTAGGGWRQKLTVRNGFPPASSAARAEKQTRTRMKQQIESLIQQLQAIPGLSQALDDIRRLPPPRYTDDEWDVVGALCNLLTLAEGQLRLLFVGSNRTDFAGITHAAIQALGTDDAPTDLVLSLDYRIKHLLVDEYQDISVNQSRLLQGLTAGWSGDDGHSLFLVGDPMQSIYRFREAEVGIFLDTWKNRQLGQIHLEPVTLRTNFRSQPGLVEWVNSTFTELMPAVEDVNTGAVRFETSVAFHNVQPLQSISVHPSFTSRGVAEADSLVRQVVEIKNAAPEESIAVLVRSRRHLLDIIPVLRKAGLEFQAVDIEGLVTRPEVQDLLALVRAVTHLADRTAWYALLRAPWCGLKLDALLILGGDSDDRTIWECIHDPQLTAQLDTDATARLDRFRHIMTAVLKDIRCQSLSRTIESAWLQLGGAATLSEKNQLNNVMIVLEYLADAAQGVFMEDVSSLVRDLETLFAVPDTVSGNPVQLMTIHKAKGLEFDHVFLPGLGRKARNNRPELLLWMQLPQQPVPGDLILAPIRESGSKQAPIYDYVNSVEKRKQDNEDRRLLYVAVTRARKTLRLFGHANIRVTREVPECYAPAGSFLHMLWPVVEPVYVNALSRHTERTPPEETIDIHQDWKRFPADWSMPMPGPLDWSGKPSAGTGKDDRDEIEFEWAGELIRHVGSVVHRCLQRMADEGIDDWDRARIQASRAWFELQLRQLGVHGEHLPVACDDVCNALNAFLDDDQGRWILSNDHLEARNEFGLTGVINNRVVNVRIDRTFVSSDGTRWIIDYKTGRHGETDLGLFLDRELERYRGQLERYARLMRALDGRPIKLGLYFPLVQGWRSWDAGR